MHYADLRKKQKEESQNTDRRHHTWEEQTFPTIHQGFITALPSDPSQSTLQLSIYYTDGSYWVRILDRLADEKCFYEIEHLETMWNDLEKALLEGKLIFKPA
ncbi:MAG: hypothetical protein ACR2RE_01390, partial [Geminicoccaceae bacterium]